MSVLKTKHLDTVPNSYIQGNSKYFFTSFYQYHGGNGAQALEASASTALDDHVSEL